MYPLYYHRDMLFYEAPRRLLDPLGKQKTFQNVPRYWPCCEKLCRHAREPLDEGVKKDMCCSFACCLSILACSTTNAVAVLPLVLVGAGTCCLVSTTTRVAAVALYGSEAPQQHPHML